MNGQLRTLLHEAADPQPPFGLADAAVREASRRRRRRVVVSGSLVAAAALVVGVGVALRPVHDDVAPQPVDVAAVPLELPMPARLPTLSEAPMDAASVAYVVDGELVLVSASDGHAAVAPSDGLASVGGATLAATLSPDGRYAVVEYSPPPTIDTIGRPLALLDVAQGGQTLLHGATVSTLSADRGIQPQLVSWAPDASWFACTCTGESEPTQVRLVERIDAQDGTIDHPSGWQGNVGGVSWGLNGLALRDPDTARWRLVPTGQLEGHPGVPEWPVVGTGAAAVMAGQDLRHFLTADAERFVVWSGIGGPERRSLGSDRLVLVSDAVQGFLVGTRPGSSGTDAAPLSVRWVSYFGELRELTQLPAGTSSASFAGALVGDPTASGAS